MLTDEEKQAQQERKRLLLEARRASLEAAKAARRDAKAQDGPKPPPAAAERVKSPPSDSLSRGFEPLQMLQNAPGSFVKNAKAILWDLPKAAAGSLLHYATHPSEYLEDVGWQKVKRFAPEIAKIVKDDYVDYYSPGNFGRQVTDDPFRLVSDLAGAASVAGGLAAKGGQLGGTALRGVSRVGAKAALGVGRAGKALQSLETLDPASAILAGAGRAYKPLADSIGMGKYSRRFKSIDATLAGEAENEAFQVAERIYAGRLTPADHDTLIESFAVGNQEKNALLASQRPDLWAAREKMRAWLEEDSKYFLDQEKFVDPGSADDALRKGWLRYKQSRGQKGVNPDGTPRELTLDDAAEGMAKGDKPVYFSLFNQKDRGMFDAFSEKLYSHGALSRAERRAMAGDVPRDIHQILSHQLRTSVGTRKSVKLARAAQEELARNGDLRVVTSKTTPEEVAALKKAGFAPFHGPFYKKYHETLGKAVNMIAEAAKKPGDVVQNVATASEQVKDVLLRAEEAISAPASEVWAPKHAVQWLNLRLNPGAADTLIGKVVNWALTMGGTLPYYKAIATVMNPRYWIANAVGDAALSFLYGIHPQALKYATTLRELVPDEIKSIGINKLYQSDYNAFMRTANKLQNYAQNIDNYFKRAVYITEQIKQGVKAKLLDTGSAFFIAERELKPFLAHIRLAPNRWVDSLNAITVAKERLAANALSVKSLDKERGKLGQEMSGIAAREKVPGEVMAEGVYSPARGEAGLYPSGVASRPQPQAVTAGDPTYGAAREAAPEVKASLAEQKAAIQDALKRVYATEFDETARNVAIDELVKKLAAIGREESSGAKVASIAPERVVPDTSDLGLGEPSVKPAAGQYDYAPGEARPVSDTQSRMMDVAKRLDAADAAREQKMADLLWQVNEARRLQEIHPMLERESMVADRAIDATAKFFGSYARLSPWEKKVIRQFIPFYTFTKAMTELAFRLPFMMPKRQFVYMNLFRTWQDLMDNDGPNNSFYDSVVPIMALANGEVLALKVNSLNPFGSIRTTGVGGAEIPSAYDILGNHPLMRIAIGNRGQLTPKPLQPGTKGTRLDNGEVYEWRGNGWKRVLLQPSFAKSLWSLFPQTQMIDSFLLPGAQEADGFALRPRTIKGPDGKVLYPIGWQERIASAVLPTSRINPTEMMKRDQMKLQQITRSYLKDLRRASPEKRAAMMTILNEMRKEIRHQYLDY